MICVKGIKVGSVLLPLEFISAINCSEINVKVLGVLEKCSSDTFFQ